jgi:hypothetical protein
MAIYWKTCKFYDSLNFFYRVFPAGIRRTFASCSRIRCFQFRFRFSVFYLQIHIGNAWLVTANINFECDLKGRGTRERILVLEMLRFMLCYWGVFWWDVREVDCGSTARVSWLRGKYFVRMNSGLHSLRTLSIIGFGFSGVDASGYATRVR